MRTIRTPEKETEFLTALASTANVTEACYQANVCRTAIYDWRRADPVFADAWEDAYKIGLDALEDEVTRRGYSGVDEPVYYKGEVCGLVRKYSDTLLIFKLKAERPDKFRDKSADAAAASEAVRIYGGLPDA